jgi:hypothetical protein
MGGSFEDEFQENGSRIWEMDGTGSDPCGASGTGPSVSSNRSVSVSGLASRHSGVVGHVLYQALSVFYVVRATSRKFGLHADNMKFVTHNE